MIDAKLILKFLMYEYPDDHLVVYLYVCGNVRSPKIAIKQAMSTLQQIFSPPMDKEFVEKVLLEYLNHKKTQYRRGLIKVQPIYQQTC